MGEIFLGNAHTGIAYLKDRAGNGPARAGIIRQITQTPGKT